MSREQVQVVGPTYFERHRRKSPPLSSLLSILMARACFQTLSNWVPSDPEQIMTFIPQWEYPGRISLFIKDDKSITRYMIPSQVSEIGVLYGL
jgi:hypothetical protein